ncbi:MAG TPA: PilZ domain-containing protein [Acidimicrobiales bacterium]
MDSPLDRRIGTRWPVAGRLRWRPRVVSRLFGRFGAKGAWHTVVVEDLSLTGARVIAPLTRSLQAGTVVDIEADGHPGTAQVRWIDPQDENSALVGVEFLELSDALRAHVESVVAAGRPETVDWRWHVAR